MNRILQSSLLRIYALIARSGILSTAWGRSAFNAAYGVYKSIGEAPHVRGLRALVVPDEIVIDIGANIGFYTKQLARWVSGKGYVIAVEPEPANLSQLARCIERSGIRSVVRVISGVASDRSGKARLAINPQHPGDHKIADDGMEVDAYTIDDLTDRDRNGRICLIKIDVQGAEERVLKGADATIARDHPAIFIELDNDALMRMGSNVERVMDWLIERGYAPFAQRGGVQPVPITSAEVISLSSNGKYADILFLQKAP